MEILSFSNIVLAFNVLLYPFMYYNYLLRALYSRIKEEKIIQKLFPCSSHQITVLVTPINSNNKQPAPGQVYMLKKV